MTFTSFKKFTPLRVYGKTLANSSSLLNAQQDKKIHIAESHMTLVLLGLGQTFDIFFKSLPVNGDLEVFSYETLEEVHLSLVEMQPSLIMVSAQINQKELDKITSGTQIPVVCLSKEKANKEDIFEVENLPISPERALDVLNRFLS